MKQAIKERLRKFPTIFALLRGTYRFFVPAPAPETPFQKEIRLIQTHIMKILGKRAPVFFVQVGSNDGVQRDPLNKLIVANRNWRGIFIEPVGSIFQRLKANYHSSERFSFENVALGARRETKKFYHVSPAAKELGGRVSSWYDQLGSFDKAHILKHCVGRNSGLEAYILEEDVECVPLEDILDKHRVKKIDLIHIDAEGFDYKVLSQVDFDRYRPAIVLYEDYHLSPDEKEGAESLLRTHGYTLIKLEEDTLAYLRS